MNLLNLPGWTVVRVHESPNDYRVDATYDGQPTHCPHCGLFGKLYRHGTRTQLLMDLPSHGRRVGIDLTRGRYRCQDCGKTFLQPLPDVDERSQMTRRLAEYIRDQSLVKTFVAVADSVGVTEGTVRNVFRAHIEELDRAYKPATPERLGIDEVHLLRKARGVFTNLQARTIIGVLPDRTKAAVVKFLRGLDASAVKVVAIDMTRAYRDAVAAVMPQAAVVVDKFHVVRMANQCLESVRKAQREALEQHARRKLMHDRFILLRRERDLTDDQRATLAGWVERFPDLGRAYRLKEDFYGLWDCKTRDEAAVAFRAWEYGITDRAMTTAYRPLLTAWRNWEPEILAYFEHRETNAITETLNGLARRIERDGRGYSFEVMRAKMLYGLKPRKRPAYGTEPTKPKSLNLLVADYQGMSVDALAEELGPDPGPTPDDEPDE